MASIVPRNGKFAVVYYEGDERHPVWKSGLSLKQAEKLKDRKSAVEKKWREQKKKRRWNETLKKERPPSNNTGKTPIDATVEEFMEDFIITYGKKHWGDSYFTSNKAKMRNYVYPYLGKNRIVDITTKIIDDFYSFLLLECVPIEKGKKQEIMGATASLVQDIHKVLRTAFNQAKRWKYILENPFNDADVPKHKSNERPALAPDELEKILEYTDDTSHYERYSFHVALFIQYHCTTRGGEIGALQWADYNPAERSLYISKTICRVNKNNLNLQKLKIQYIFPVQNPYNKTIVVLKNPKTEATRRFCKLNNLLMGKLDLLRMMQKGIRENLFGDEYQDNHLIICQENGRPIMPEQLNRKFKDVIVEMRESGYSFTSVPERLLDKVVFHSIRAASVTKKMQVSNGNIKAVMSAGGWAEPDMVIRYTRDYEKDQDDITKRMEDDYLKKRGAKVLGDEEQVLQIIRDHPELIPQILSATYLLLKS